MSETTKSFRQLRVWQEAINFADAIYTLSDKFPKHEIYGLSQQIRRAAVSVPSNIAEGCSRANKGEFIQFLHIAKASLPEVETQLIISQRRNYCDQKTFEIQESQIVLIEKMIVKLIKSIKDPLPTLNIKPSTLNG